MNGKAEQGPGRAFIEMICRLYHDRYDDREEDSRPGGESWQPGVKALHTSLEQFRKELGEKGVRMSTTKIRKILITGGMWSTERSREVMRLYEKTGSVGRVAEELGLSAGAVITYLPYRKGVYDLEEKSGNARRIERFREKQKHRNR